MILYFLYLTYYNIEILISDNASPDNKTEKVVNKFAKKDKRIVFFKQDQNIGLCLDDLVVPPLQVLLRLQVLLCLLYGLHRLGYLIVFDP